MWIKDAAGRFLMQLEDLRQKVAFHNSVDVWIAACNERNVSWDNPTAYKKFIEHMLQKNLNLKAFNLCAHESGAVDEKKTAFTETLAQSKETDPNSRNYTIRLSDNAISIIREYNFE